METIDILLENIPDKPEHYTTTSHKFKRDLWNYCSADGFYELTCVELGTHNGQTTRFLSRLFNKVITINVNDSVQAKQLNSDVTNINYIQTDLYHDDWTKQISNGDVFFIDALHHTDAVLLDVSNCLKIKSNIQKKIFIFDDYGLNHNGVSNAVDLLLENGVINLLGYIGHESGWKYGDGPDRILNNFEGIICQEV